MTYHALVESVSAISAVRSDAGSQAIVWHSSSPMVIEELRRVGETVFWIEDAVSPDLLDQVGVAVIGTLERLEPYLDAAERTVEITGLAAMVGVQLHHVLSALLYKQATLTQWASHYKNAVVAGSPELRPAGANLSIDSFDTLYAALAAEQENGQRVVRHQAPVPNLAEIKDRPSLIGRLLSLSDFSRDLVLWRLLRFVFGGRLRLPNRGPLVLVTRDNETIRAALPFLLGRVSEIKLVPSQPTGVRSASPLDGLPGADAIEAMLRACCPVEMPLAPVARLIAARLHQASGNWHSLMSASRSSVATYLSGERRPVVVLSNAPPGVGGAAMLAAMREHHAKVVIAEHGVSAGLSAVHIAMRPWSEARLADRYLVACDNSYEFFAAETRIGSERLRVVGLPRVVRSIPLRAIQRILGRIMLGAVKKKLVLYLARPEQNNQRRLPQSPFDRDVYALQRAIVTDIFPRVKGRPVFKSYPSQRYLDPNPVGHPAVPLAANTIFVGRGDFRYIRAAADIIIVESLMSTIGFVFGSGIPIVFLHQPGIEPLPDILAGLRRSVFVFDVRDGGWKDRLTDFLNQPPGRILDLWEQMASEREKFIAQFIAGPGNNGERAADATLSLAVSDLKPN